VKRMTPGMPLIEPGKSNFGRSNLQAALSNPDV
jgi:hypothetical protein